MPGMMIQDFLAVPETGGGSPAAGQKKTVTQPFGRVLGHAAAKTAAAKTAAGKTAAGKTSGTEKKTGDSGAEKVEAKRSPAQKEEISKKKDKDKDDEKTKNAVPLLFLAALFDLHSAEVKMKGKPELVAASKRVQQVFAQGLQIQSNDKGTEETGPENADLASLVLSPKEMAELKQLMAGMTQSGQIPESVQGDSLFAKLQQQLDAFGSLATVKGVVGNEAAMKGVVVDEAAMKGVIAKKAAGKGVAVKEAAVKEAVAGTPPVLKASLQENQIAKIFKPQQAKATLHERQFAQSEAALATSANVASTGADSSLKVASFASDRVKNTMSSLEDSLQLQPAAAPVLVAQGLVSPLGTSADKVMQLPSGLLLAENQVVEQVVTHLVAGSDGQSSRMQLRLHPAELGSLRLDLVVEGDRVRAHLQAQTQQVQAVLDRHLPQLRDALQQQGLKIDEFRVDFQNGQGQAQQQGFSWQQQQGRSQQHSPQSSWLPHEEPAELEISRGIPLSQGDTGLSLRI